MMTQKEINDFGKSLNYFGYNLFNGFTRDMSDDYSHEDFLGMFNLLMMAQDDNRRLLKLSKI